MIDALNAKEIGERIKEARIKAGYTSLTEFSATLSMDMGTVSRWENGHTIPPSDKLILLATTLDTSIDYLLTNVKNENKTLVSQLGLSNDAIECLKKQQEEGASIDASAINLLFHPIYREVLGKLYVYLRTNYKKPYINSKEQLYDKVPLIVFPSLFPSENHTIGDVAGKSVDVLVGREETEDFESSKAFKLMNELIRIKEKAYENAPIVDMKFEEEEKKDE